MQCFNCGPATGSASNNAEAIIAPGKVITPGLGTWAEQRNHVTTDWIRGIKPGAFELVATIASQAKVFNIRRAASGQRDNVIHYHRDTHYLWTAAITTPVAGLLRYLPANGGPNLTTWGHRGAGSSVWEGYIPAT